MKNVLLILNEQKLIVLFYKYIKLSNIMKKYPKCYKLITKIAFKITKKKQGIYMQRLPFGGCQKTYYQQIHIHLLFILMTRRQNACHVMFTLSYFMSLKKLCKTFCVIMCAWQKFFDSTCILYEIAFSVLFTFFLYYIRLYFLLDGDSMITLFLLMRIVQYEM